LLIHTGSSWTMPGSSAAAKAGSICNARSSNAGDGRQTTDVGKVLHNSVHCLV
jgi:hypothetical protein